MGSEKRKYSKEYNEYMNSPQWAAKRLKVLKRDGHKCTNCGAEFNLHIHHLTYIRFTHENLKDLTTLCYVCHKAIHPDIKKPGPKPKPKVLIEIAEGVLVPKGQRATSTQLKKAKKINRKQKNFLRWKHQIRAKRN